MANEKNPDPPHPLRRRAKFAPRLMRLLFPAS